MRNSEGTFYACKRVSTPFKKSCSPVFLDKHEESKQKISPHFCNKEV